MDASLENLLAGLESRFDATIARDEEIAAADLARSLERGADLRHRLGRADGGVFLLLGESRLAVARVGLDYCACGEPAFLVAPLHTASFALTGTGSPPPDTPTTLKQTLGRWADRAETVLVEGSAGSHAGRLVQSCADHLVLGRGDRRILVPLATVSSVRLSRVG